jgi:hypothetical protein
LRSRRHALLASAASLAALTGILLLPAVASAQSATPTISQARDLATAASVAGQLSSVTCAGARNCWAVGSTSGNVSAGFIEHWNGSAWKVAPSHNPPKSSSSLLDGVACARVTSCWAVGYSTIGAHTIPYAEHWNGGAWSELALPYPAHETLVVNLLRAVSCPAARLCFADGGYLGQSGFEASLIERWNGRSWKIVTAPVLRRSTTTDLEGLSCARARDCWATGDWLHNAVRGGALGYHWNGRRWTSVAITDTRYSISGDLYAVSCPARRMCMAIGSRAYSGPNGPGLLPFAQRWDGSSWVAAPVASTAGSLQSVSCATSRRCVAVGTAHDATRVEQWNGSSWATVPSPNPAGALGSGLEGVTCRQVTNCWAVGNWARSPGQANVLIEHWNGTAWTIVAS